MKKEEKYLIAIVRCFLNGGEYPEEMEDFSCEEKGKIIMCAKKHGLLPFLQECPVFMKEPYRKKIFSYLKHYAYKDVQQTHETEELLRCFEEKGIFCMPLKGMRTKQYYPYPELRTMGDMDILYKKEQTDVLKKIMAQRGYEFEGHSVKHDHYEKQGVTVEMHRDLLPVQSRAYTYFLDIWQRASAAEGKSYQYEMRLEDHYLFTLYHLIEHFIRGGVGIRMILDIYILSGQPEFNREYVDRELQVLEIADFEEHIRNLAYGWFGKKDRKTAEDRERRELEDYVLAGGIFGSREMERQNGTVMFLSKGKFLRYLFFPSYENMKTAYPWLKTPWLLPVAWLMKYSLVLRKRRQHFGHHIKRFRAFDKADTQMKMQRVQFFEKYGLGNMFQGYKEQYGE